MPIMEKGLVDKDPSVLGAVIGLWKQLIQVQPCIKMALVYRSFLHDKFIENTISVRGYITNSV